MAAFYSPRMAAPPDAHGTRYVQGTETLTQFPGEVHLHFSIRDFPCSPQLEQTNARMVLTRPVVSSMQLYLYWKRGLELRPVVNPKVERASIAPIVPYAVELAGQLPERYEWSYEITVPSAGVPLTDDLVLILRAPDGKIAARVAARRRRGSSRRSANARSSPARARPQSRRRDGWPPRSRHRPVL